MLAQIIFFTAVALFLIILLRRSSVLETAWRVVAAFGLAAGSFFRSSFLAARKRAKQQATQFKMPNVNLGTTRRRIEDISTGGNGHDFWKEEFVEEKPEILTHYDEGEAMFKAGKYDDAEKYFLTAATRNPKDPKVYARLGLIYLHKKNYSDAIEALKVAVKLDKYNPTRHYNLALAYAGKNDNQRAIATIREAISLDPVSQRYRALLEQLLNKK